MPRHSHEFSILFIREKGVTLPHTVVRAKLDYTIMTSHLCFLLSPLEMFFNSSILKGLLPEKLCPIIYPSSTPCVLRSIGKTFGVNQFLNYEAP